MDLASETERGDLFSLVRKIDAKAQVMCTQFSDVDVKSVINTGLFNMRKQSSLHDGYMSCALEGAGTSQRR